MTMKRLLMTMAAASALSVGAPAAAQYARGDVQAGVQQLQMELQTGIRSGAISRREAMPLAEQIRQIDDYARVNGRDGLNGRERMYLRQRIANLRQHILYAEQTGDGRDQRYGRADGYGQAEGYGRADRYDGNRAYGASDGSYARGQEDGGYLRVGERISENFGEMPDRYRDRYRDSEASYYRYDRGNVYQVDARTNLILRIIADAR